MISYVQTAVLGLRTTVESTWRVVYLFHLTICGHWPSSCSQADVCWRVAETAVEDCNNVWLCNTILTFYSTRAPRHSTSSSDGPTTNWQAVFSLIQSRRGGERWAAVVPSPFNFGLSKNCRKIFFLSENLVETLKVPYLGLSGLNTFYLRKFVSKIKSLSTRNRKFAVCWQIATCCPAYFLTHVTDALTDRPIC